MRKLESAQRRKRILAFATKNPDFSPLQIAAALGFDNTAVRNVLSSVGRTYKKISLSAISRKVREAVPPDWSTWS